MKKIYLALILLICTVQLEAQQTTAIPDQNFEQALIDLGYDIGTPDGFVLTDSIKNIIKLDIGLRKITDLTGIAYFTKLQVLYCNNNSISSLDLSSNKLLTDVQCAYNSISSLDLSSNIKLEKLQCSNSKLQSLNISNCLQLTELTCSYNSLTILDISNNKNLTTLWCDSNHITNIDFSNNKELQVLDCSQNALKTIDVSECTKLFQFFCMNNKLIHLDLSSNYDLKFLVCSYNSLTYLNLKNGNNLKLQSIIMKNNPNLECIIVDNPWFSIQNWGTKYVSSKDSIAQYTTAPCGSNLISGKVFYDSNSNCNYDLSDHPLLGYLIKISGNFESYKITDNNGNYSFLVDSNLNVNVSLVKPVDSANIGGYCKLNGYTFNTGGSNFNTSNVNFGLKLKPYSKLSINISKTRMRRCFRNSTKISCQNDGTKDEYNVRVYVQYPEYVSLISATKPISNVDIVNKIYMFTLDTLKAFSKSEINLIDSVNCGNEDIRFYTQCIKTWITPKSKLFLTKDTLAWDKSNISVIQRPKCLGDSIVQFTIKNKGTGNMNIPQKYRLYYNNEITDSGSFKLSSNDSLIIGSSADGSTIRLEADQYQNYPGQSIPRATIEGCGSSTPAKASLGFWPRSQCDDLDPDVSEICLEIRDSYDPNEKTVSPSGITAKNYVPTKGPLHYSIGFQNTGSDTAYKIVVVDTLSKNLDLSTLVITGASHKYTYSISGQSQPILEFTFNNINLPDSTTDEAHSHGFISYTLYPNDSIIPKSTIDNFADIYFDYNSPIRTNTTHVVAFDTTIVSNKIISVKLISSPTSILDLEVPKIKISPNPCSQNIEVESLNNDYNLLKIYSSNGSLILVKTISCKDKIDVSTLNQGAYFIIISNHAGNQFKYEIIKR